MGLEAVAPSVSIIMNCLNGEKYLREAIDSIYGQTFKDWEIIFWDNASTDSSAVIAKSYDDKIKYFKSEKTVTLSKARNWALGKAHGKYIAFLDCDDRWLPQKLERQIRVLDESWDVALVYSNFHRVYPDGEKVLALRGTQPEGRVFWEFLCDYPVGMLTAVVRRDAIEAVGGSFDESLKIAEDYDLFMHIVYSREVAYLNDSLAAYRMHDMRRTLAYKYNYVDECEYVVNKIKRSNASFSDRHEKELAFFTGNMARLRAKIAMSEGDAALARRYLDGYKFVGPVFFLSYIITFLPPYVWRRLNYMKNKGFLF